MAPAASPAPAPRGVTFTFSGRTKHDTWLPTAWPRTVRARSGPISLSIRAPWPAAATTPLITLAAPTSRAMNSSRGEK